MPTHSALLLYSGDPQNSPSLILSYMNLCQRNIWILHH